MNKGDKEDNDPRQQYEYSNAEHGGTLGTATLESNKVFLRKGSVIPVELDEPGFKGFKETKPVSVFEE